MLLARVIIAPQEIPVGIITALVGAPFFLVGLAEREESRILVGMEITIRQNRTA